MLASLITLIIYILVLGLIFWLLHYLIDAIPIAEPFNRIAKVVLLVASVIIVIVLLLQFAGVGLDTGLPRVR